MTFPFSVCFDRPLKAIITIDNQGRILQYIEKYVIEGKANNVIVEDTRVTYKGSTSGWNTALYRAVDNGTFVLLYKDNQWFLRYQINMYQLFIITSIMSIGIGVFMLVGGGPWWIGIIGFLWLCGANWIINLIRHGIVATNVAIGINELICGKEQHTGVDNDKINGPLKSWF